MKASTKTETNHALVTAASGPKQFMVSIIDCREDKSLCLKVFWHTLFPSCILVIFPSGIDITFVKRLMLVTSVRYAKNQAFAKSTQKLVRSWPPGGTVCLTRDQ